MEGGQYQISFSSLYKASEDTELEVELRAIKDDGMKSLGSVKIAPGAASLGLSSTLVVPLNN